jgi:hypothetical protein
MPVRCLFTLLLLCSHFAAAPAQQTAPSPIDRLSFLIGTWDTTEGDEHVRMKVWRAPSGSALLYHLDVEHGGKVTPRYDGMYYWQPVAKTFVIRQVAINGNAIEGEFNVDGNHATQTETVFNATGTTAHIVIDYTFTPDSFHAVAKFQPGGSDQWVPAIDQIYHRTAE